MNPFYTLLKQRQFQRRQEDYRLAQGRLTAVEAAELLAGDKAIPLCTVQPRKGEPVTIGMDAQPSGGHLLVVGAPWRVWADQLTCTLAQWPDAALVVDPGGKLHHRTAHFRQRHVGPVYTLPGYKLDLGYYYRFWHETQARKLHAYLMYPYPPEERWPMERSVALFTAVGHYAHVYKRNLMHLLLDVASCDMWRALQGLESTPFARFYVRQFTKGQSPAAAIHDTDVVEAFGMFALQLQRYQDYYHLFAAEPEREAIPQEWLQKRGTIYLTFDPVQLADIGGLVTAVVAGLVRYHLSHGNYQRLLLVLDVDTASQIAHFTRLLEMVGDYGITVVLVAPSWEALGLVGGEEKREQVLRLFSHQLWYAPQHEATAQQMSKLLGSQLGPDSLTKEAVLTREEILAWSTDTVLVHLRRERPYRFLGQPLTLPPDIHMYQSPLLPPTSAPAPRHYLDWLPAVPVPQPTQVRAQNPPSLPPAVEIIVPRQEETRTKRPNQTNQTIRPKKQGLK